MSEHIAFVRAGRREAGHLLPVPRSREALEVLSENIRVAQDHLPVPLALENVAGLFDWPDAELDEAEFLSELADRTGVLLLLDLANLYANGTNFRFDPMEMLSRWPLEQVVYVHVAGGVERDGFYQDTHAHPVPEPVVALVEALAARAPRPPAVMVERDGHYPSEDGLRSELATIRAAARLEAPLRGR